MLVKIYDIIYRKIITIYDYCGDVTISEIRRSKNKRTELSAKEFADWKKGWCLLYNGMMDLLGNELLARFPERERLFLDVSQDPTTTKVRKMSETKFEKLYTEKKGDIYGI